MRWTRARSAALERRQDRPAVLAFGAVAGAVAIAVAGALGGCTIVRNSLGTHDSACFKALPAADGAVHSAGHFSGLRYTTIGDLESAVRHTPGGGGGAPPPGGLELPRRTGVCVVAYNGHFQTGAVLDGWSPTGVHAGHFAIVLVRQSDLKVLATVVMEHEPLRFIRTFPRL